MIFVTSKCFDCLRNLHFHLRKSFDTCWRTIKISLLLTPIVCQPFSKMKTKPAIVLTLSMEFFSSRMWIRVETLSSSWSNQRDCFKKRTLFPRCTSLTYFERKCEKVSDLFWAKTWKKRFESENRFGSWFLTSINVSETRGNNRMLITKLPSIMDWSSFPLPLVQESFLKPWVFCFISKVTLP